MIAIIEAGRVANLLVGDEQAALLFEGGLYVSTDTNIGIGWQYVDGTFIEPKPEDGGEA
ncbi:hypothetical protein GCM10007972_27690 [Iodidimonas muriae]|uniref:Uncharacterized protein n=1 Tax=Iodidimonas muriae TaxID=261467 RepID=A0ABQ2LH80_9PROT|nr:hypothetical protein [Iodidimonas muriae]GER08810.1 hypothetical protein JCM17843_31200 [Kordiimonadales bacterium JCM 17843]GGO17528.1 hypothetical protein GCM10007972_27690 [Iodidimonas muriae]